jgi:hypothetical protein
MSLGKYRYNKQFHLIAAEEFLKNLLNDKNVVSSFEPLRGIDQCNEVKYTHLNCNVLNMSYFDVFKDLDFLTEKGDIRQNYEQRMDGMVLGDRLRQAWLWEETEDVDAWDTLHTDKYSKEFIFQLFMHI